jgi:hypothetical protein
MFQQLSTQLAVVLLLLGAAACAPRRGPEAEEVVPEVRFQNLRFEVYRDAALEASGTVADARMRRDTSALTGDQIAVDFPPAPGRQSARFSASHGTGNASDRWFLLDAGVRAEQAGHVVTTERARFDGWDRLVRGDAPVQVRGERYLLQGPGFTLDPAARTVRIEDGARLRAGAEPPPPERGIAP